MNLQYCTVEINTLPCLCDNYNDMINSMGNVFMKLNLWACWHICMSMLYECKKIRIYFKI